MFSPKTLALAGLVFTNLFWAGNAIVARFVVESIPPFTLSFIRWAVAFVLIAPFGWFYLRGQWQEVRRQWGVLTVLGILGITIYNTVLYLAAHSTTAINMTLVSSTLPLVTVLMAWLFLFERPDRWQLFGIALSLVGLFIIVANGQPLQLLQLQFNHGDLLILGIAGCWALYSVILRKYPVNLHPVALLTLLIAIGLPFILLLYVLEWWLLPPFSVDWRDAPVILYTAIFPSLLAFLFWGYSIRHVGPNIAALSSYLMPLFTVCLAVPMLGESLYSYHLLGGVLILLGLYSAIVLKQR